MCILFCFFFANWWTWSFNCFEFDLVNNMWQHWKGHAYYNYLTFLLRFLIIWCRSVLFVLEFKTKLLSPRSEEREREKNVSNGRETADLDTSSESNSWLNASFIFFFRAELWQKTQRIIVDSIFGSKCTQLLFSWMREACVSTHFGVVDNKLTIGQ